MTTVMSDGDDGGGDDGGDDDGGDCDCDNDNGCFCC